MILPGMTAVFMAFALIVASPAAAQDAGSPARILDQMPKALEGAPAVKMENGIMMYMIPGPDGKPTIVVALTVMEKEGFVSPEQLRGLAVEMVKDFGLRQVLREGAFTTPMWSSAPTFFGEYATDKGFTQSWSLVTGKEGMNVTAVFANGKDARRVEALVAEKIFRGAVVSAGKPADRP
ncbi:MAG TPA: hypothetical protein VF574_17930 [Allosphingosinicella sp.]|jgi:hypothetical protein